MWCFQHGEFILISIFETHIVVFSKFYVIISIFSDLRFVGFRGLVFTILISHVKYSISVLTDTECKNPICTRTEKYLYTHVENSHSFRFIYFSP